MSPACVGKAGGVTMDYRAARSSELADRAGLLCMQDMKQSRIFLCCNGFLPPALPGKHAVSLGLGARCCCGRLRRSFRSLCSGSHGRDVRGGG